MEPSYRALADKVLGMLREGRADDNSDGHLTMDKWEWPAGVALYGLFKVYEKTADRQALAYLTQWYDRALAMEPPHKNVNTVGPMLALCRLYEECRNEAYRPHILRWADWVMKEMPRTEFGGLQHATAWNKHYQQLWDDTLFMTALFLARAGLALERPDWVEEAAYQFLLHIRYLQDKVTGLFYHGWTFDRRHNFAGAFWARGNGWFTAAAVEFLEMMGYKGASRRTEAAPRGEAACRFVEAALRDQVRALWKLQRENGLFTTLVDVEETYCETSATAAVAYGVLKGVRLGYVDGCFAQMGMAAARAVVGQIGPEGEVSGVSGGTGMGHTPDHYRNIKICPTAYGQGLAFLMLTELL